MNKILKYKGILIPSAIGLVIAIAMTITSFIRTQSITHALCDGFFVAGGLLVCVGGLSFSRNHGMFDGISYSVSHLFATRWPGLSPLDEYKRHETYADYKDRVRANRSSPKNLLISGGIYLAVAFIFLLMHGTL